jgi:hypothetical protein
MSEQSDVGSLVGEILRDVAENAIKLCSITQSCSTARSSPPSKYRSPS